MSQESEAQGFILPRIVPDSARTARKLAAAEKLAEAAKQADECMDTLRPSFHIMGRLVHDGLKAALQEWQEANKDD